ncbi:RNA-directed DNA polymerase from mobile element jockey-like protein [Labeo rohita]|uniref:RNA-directed DNA polymerase from mobile element jockey-like protein n=1 Tax=Labeo rohita TaxID=84645 RepID=A0A498MPQ8_LABRO|nr:RNA-directed DNA polymerase from mobile element jockey-like protein [Labeo rohita]
MWQGVQHLTNYRINIGAAEGDLALAEELNIFFACFEATAPETAQTHQAHSSMILTSEEHELHKWQLLERYPVLLLARRTSNGFSAECFCPWKMETEDAEDAFVTIKRLYESLLNVAIAEKATSRVGETPAPNSKQTETPPIHNTADPASESTPLLPCNVSTLTQSVLKFSQPSPISSSLASPLPPASILSASSKLNPVSTEHGSPDTVSYAPKEKRKTEPKECPIHKDSTSFPYKKFLRKRIREWDEVEKHLGATRKHSKFVCALM